MHMLWYNQRCLHLYNLAVHLTIACTKHDVTRSEALKSGLQCDTLRCIGFATLPVCSIMPHIAVQATVTRCEHMPAS